MSSNSNGSDNLDQASVLQDAMNNAGIAQAAFLSAPEKHPSFDGESCIKCGEVIPTARLLMGRIRCVACQTILERRR
jgi:RNA polymerase-binding transcription factor DksA